MQHTLRLLPVVVALCALAACSSPEEKAAAAKQEAAEAQKEAYQADTEMKQERMKLLEEYKACVKKAQDENKDVESCDYLLKAVEATK